MPRSASRRRSSPSPVTAGPASTRRGVTDPQHVGSAPANRHRRGRCPIRRRCGYGLCLPDHDRPSRETDRVDADARLPQVCGDSPGTHEVASDPGAAGVTHPSPPTLTRYGPSRHPSHSPPRLGGGTDFDPGGVPPSPPFLPGGGGTSFGRVPSPPKAPGVTGRCRESRLFARRPVRDERRPRSSDDPGGSPGAVAPWVTHTHGARSLPRNGGGARASMALDRAHMGYLTCVAVARPSPRRANGDTPAWVGAPARPRPDDERAEQFEHAHNRGRRPAPMAASGAAAMPPPPADTAPPGSRSSKATHSRSWGRWSTPISSWPRPRFCTYA